MPPPTLLLTRPRSSAQAFADTLDRAAYDAVTVIFAPLMEIVGIQATLPLDRAGGVVFTSANGVLHTPAGAGQPAYCVGAQTTEKARARGWDAHEAGENAAALVKTLLATRPDGPLVHLGGEYTIGDIAQTLTAAGIPTRHIAIYAQNLLPLSGDAIAALSHPSIIPVFSARSAAKLAEEASGRLGFAHIVALSDSVAVPLKGENLAQMHIVPSPQAGYMRNAVENLCLTLSVS
jgi:uroporphyrinogen-III synthase